MEDIMKKKRLPWRCLTAKQARDKAKIYNSREWKELRAEKLRLQPLCEKCLADGKAAGVPDGWIRSAHCVHHIVPIETAQTKEEMRRLALCGLDGLMSLCDKCHADIHNQQGYHTRDAVRQRADDRQKRWEEKIMARFKPSLP